VGIEGRVAGAAGFGAARRVGFAIAVLDSVGGHVYCGGACGSARFPSESLVKLFIATELLAQKRLTGPVEELAWKMITQSDDKAATALYQRAGGDSVVDRIENRYRVEIGYRPSRQGWWGTTHVSATGLVRFLARAKADPAVGPWLLNAMRLGTYRGSDTFDQWFGIPAYAANAAFKQGWGDDDDTRSQTLNSVGLVDDRYAVAILVNANPPRSPRYVRDTINGIAARLFPDGHLTSAGSSRGPGTQSVRRAGLR
jgi:hypothetical protein